MIYAPFRHQKLAHDFCMTHEHCGLFMGMG